MNSLDPPLLQLYRENGVVGSDIATPVAQLLHSECPDAHVCWTGTDREALKADWNRVHLPYIGATYAHATVRVVVIG